MPDAFAPGSSRLSAPRANRVSHAATTETARSIKDFDRRL